MAIYHTYSTVSLINANCVIFMANRERHSSTHYENQRKSTSAFSPFAYDMYLCPIHENGHLLHILNIATLIVHTVGSREWPLPQYLAYTLHFLPSNQCELWHVPYLLYLLCEPWRRWLRTDIGQDRFGQDRRGFGWHGGKLLLLVAEDAVYMHSQRQGYVSKSHSNKKRSSLWNILTWRQMLHP